MDIDRIAIDDVGGNPTKIAQAVTGQISDLSPPIPVREIAAALDIYEIREEQLSGLEGGLITPEDKSEGAILVNSNRPETRKRYTISHELGHYLNPWHKSTNPEGFRCSSKDMAIEQFQTNNRLQRMEVEANEFAAALLMPMRFVHSFMRQRMGADLEHILSMAKKFEVSREAAARRYVVANDEPAAVVFSKGDTIRYIKKHQHFPFLDVWNGDPLPNHSVSFRSKLPIGELSDWEAVDANIWLREPKGQEIYEQTLAQQNGFRLTLITLNDDESTDDECERAWPNPTFHR